MTGENSPLFLRNRDIIDDKPNKERRRLENRPSALLSFLSGGFIPNSLTQSIFPITLANWGSAIEASDREEIKGEQGGEPAKGAEGDELTRGSSASEGKEDPKGGDPEKEED